MDKAQGKEARNIAIGVVGGAVVALVLLVIGLPPLTALAVVLPIFSYLVWKHFYSERANIGLLLLLANLLFISGALLWDNRVPRVGYMLCYQPHFAVAENGLYGLSEFEFGVRLISDDTDELHAMAGPSQLVIDNLEGESTTALEPSPLQRKGLSIFSSKTVNFAKAGQVPGQGGLRGTYHFEVQYGRDPSDLDRTLVANGSLDINVNTAMKRAEPSLTPNESESSPGLIPKECRLDNLPR